MVVTKMDSMTLSGVAKVCLCLTEYRGVPCTRGWDIGVERGTVGVKVRVGGIEVEISSGAQNIEAHRRAGPWLTVSE